MAIACNTVFSATIEDTAILAGNGGGSAYSFKLARRLQWLNATGELGLNVAQLFNGTLGGSPMDIDLHSFTDRAGRGTLAFAKTRLIIIHALAANSGTMKFFDATATNPWNAWAKDIILNPDAIAILEDRGATAVAVTSGSSQTFRISGTSGDKFEVFIGGQ